MILTETAFIIHYRVIVIISVITNNLLDEYLYFELILFTFGFACSDPSLSPRQRPATCCTRRRRNSGDANAGGGLLGGT